MWSPTRVALGFLLESPDGRTGDESDERMTERGDLRRHQDLFCLNPAAILFLKCPELRFVYGVPEVELRFSCRIEGATSHGRERNGLSRNLAFSWCPVFEADLFEAPLHRL